MKQCLAMSSKDSDADSCCRQGYDYDNDVIDMLRQNKESDSDSTKTGKKSTDSSVKSNRHQQYDDDNESENGDCAASSEGGSDYNSDSESESQPEGCKNKATFKVNLNPALEQVKQRNKEFEHCEKIMIKEMASKNNLLQ